MIVPSNRPFNRLWSLVHSTSRFMLHLSLNILLYGILVYRHHARNAVPVAPREIPYVDSHPSGFALVPKFPTQHHRHRIVQYFISHTSYLKSRISPPSLSSSHSIPSSHSTTKKKGHSLHPTFEASDSFDNQPGPPLTNCATRRQ